MLTLEQIVSDIAQAIKDVDAGCPGCKKMPGGIGAFSEPKMVGKLCVHLQECNPQYREIQTEFPYPESRRGRCDVIIPGCWAIEFKLSQIWMAKGTEDGAWTSNILHPFLGVEDAGAKSLIGDAIKLMCSGFQENKAIVLLHFARERDGLDPDLPLRMFEYAASELLGIPLGRRVTVSVDRLIHPRHQQAVIFAWQVGERKDRKPGVRSEWLDGELNRLSQVSTRKLREREGLQVSADMTAGQLKAAFREIYGAELKLYRGRSEAVDGAVLKTLTKVRFREGILPVSPKNKIKNIEASFREQFGLRVQVEIVAGTLAKNSATLAKVSRKRRLINP